MVKFHNFHQTVQEYYCRGKENLFPTLFECPQLTCSYHEPWEGKTVFGEYPVFIRPGNFMVTLLFHDKESINRFCQLLMDTIFEIDAELGQPGRSPVQLKLRKSK